MNKLIVLILLLFMLFLQQSEAKEILYNCDDNEKIINDDGTVTVALGKVNSYLTHDNRCIPDYQLNISNGNYTYLIDSSNPNYYLISADEVSFRLPNKSWIQYEFYPYLIKETMTVQSLASLQDVSVGNASVRYIPLPFNPSIASSQVGNILQLGRFKTKDFWIRDANNNYYDVEHNYTLKVVNGEIRLYFNNISWFQNAVYPLTIDPTLTIQGSDNPDSQISGWVGYNDNTNYGTTYIQIQTLTGLNRRAILRFNTKSIIPSNAEITSATLGLYFYWANQGTAEGRSYIAYPIWLNRTETWTESGVTWNKYDGSNLWTNVGADYNSTPSASQTVPPVNNWMNWSVTQLVSDAHNNSNNVSFLIKDSAENSGSTHSAIFYSRDTNVSFAPFLLVTYQSTVPLVPSNLSSITSNFWVNHTWNVGSSDNTDSFNVSFNNGSWLNGTTNTYVNNTLSAHAWQNVTVWAWNNTGDGTLSATGTTLNTQIPNNLPTVPVLIQHPDYHSISGTTNVSWTSTDVDTDNLTYDVQVYNRTTGLLIVNQTGVSSNYSQNFSLLNWTTYNHSARAYDGYGYSAWATALEFSFTNSLPSIQNVTISPVNAGVTDNLTASINVTDSDGDTLTNHFLWYKNSVLQTAWNDTLIINYTGNYTSGDTIYVKGYANDSYNDSIQVQSNSVIIGSGNSAPILPGISLNPSTRKYNKTIWVNTTANITDAESTLVRLQVYYYNGSDKIYFTNSSWFTPPDNSSVQITIPWSDGLNYTIYAQVQDNGNVTQDNTTNLTSTEATATFISDITVPTIVTSSVSATGITVGNSVLITAQFNGQDANISSALVRVERPDATVLNWTMTCGSGENVTCTYTYTSTSDIGQYFIRFFYPSDDSGNSGTIVSALTFTASAASSGSSGGGGGGYIPSPTSPPPIIVTVTPNISTLLPPINFVNTTDTRSIADLEKIGQCLSKDLMLSSLCAGGTINIVTNPMNYWVLVGAFIGSFVLMYILAIYNEKKIAWFTDPLILGVAAIIITMTFTLVGFNMFFFNYIFEDSRPLLMTASFMMWGGFVSTAGFQMMYGGQKRNKTFEFIIGTPVKQTNDWAKHEWNKLLR